MKRWCPPHRDLSSTPNGASKDAKTMNDGYYVPFRRETNDARRHARYRIIGKQHSSTVICISKKISDGSLRSHILKTRSGR